ncbi:hypothetical protein FDUTEX481_00695 [Tolypothrix sp. PCC 7601]|nr:hypothetical protein FDUTEX481_00695 [Tolypothrix sp. PCC 7601]BAY92727.1 hypothetical protein NIES3275_47640 [Microchaete diplosiphon NIES-3275]
MSHFPVNIANLVLTKEQYHKLKFYADSQHISLQESIILLIDSLPKPSQSCQILNNRYSILSSRKFLQSFYEILN